MGHKYFIHRRGLEKLTDLAEKGGGFKEIEMMVIMEDFDLMVPDPEERKQWVQIKFMVYGGN